MKDELRKNIDELVTATRGKTISEVAIALGNRMQKEGVLELTFDQIKEVIDSLHTLP